METIICMGIGSVLMLLAIKLLHQSFLQSKQTQSRFDVAIAQNRLARQFRKDAWAADDATVTKNQDTQELSFKSIDSPTISYRDLGGFVQRKTERDGIPAIYETYSLAVGTRASFDFDSNRHFASLSIHFSVFENNDSERSTSGNRFLVYSRVNRIGNSIKLNQDTALAIEPKEQP